MDKTIEVVLVATVVIMTAAAVMFLFSNQLGGFDDSASQEASSAECQIIKTRAENKCSGPSDTISTPSSWTDSNCGETDVEAPQCG